MILTCANKLNTASRRDGSCGEKTDEFVSSRDIWGREPCIARRKLQHYSKQQLALPPPTTLPQLVAIRVTISLTSWQKLQLAAICCMHNAPIACNFYRKRQNIVRSSFPVIELPRLFPAIVFTKLCKNRQNYMSLHIFVKLLSSANSNPITCF